MRVPVPIAGPSKQDRVIQCNSQRSINMYASAKTGAKSDLVMYSHPGRKRIASVGIGPHRANPIKWSGYHYWVSGSEVYKQDTSNNFTLLTTALSTSGSRVVFAAGRDYLMLVDGTYGYYTQGSSITRITDGDFPANPSHVEYLDGYFIVNKGGTDEFYINETTEDPTGWNALDFDVAAKRPDAATALKEHGGDLYILGDESTQTFFNSGNADFPFTSYPSSMSAGIQAPHSLVSSINGLFWLGKSKEGDYAIVAAKGSNIIDISDDELKWQINQLSVTSDAVAWVRRQAGISFYEITFPAAGRTWSYCIENPGWSELKSYGSTKFGCNCYGFFNGKHYVGDDTDGMVYELDFDTYTDDSDPHIRTRTTRVVHKDGLSLTFRSLILDAEAGIGLITGQGSDPQVMMRYSADGGRTFSATLMRSLGKIGKPETKPQWNNLGSGYDWVFEFSFSDPTKFAMMNLFADITVGRH